MRVLLAGVLLAACAKPGPPPPPPEPPLHIGPSLPQKQCDLIKYGGQKFDADMQAVPIEKALRGLADCTCFHFELDRRTRADITLSAPKPLNADELFAEFLKAADAAGVTVRRQQAVFVVEPK